MITQESILAEEERAEAEERAKQKQAEAEERAKQKQAEEDKIAREKKDKEDNEKAKQSVKVFSYVLLIVIGAMLLGAAFD